MACVTLKRPLAHADYPYENGSQTPGGVGPAGPSVSAPGASAMGGSPHQIHPHHRPPPSKRRRCFPMASLKEQERELFEANNSGFKSAYAAASGSTAAGCSTSSPQMPSLPVRPSSSVFKETSALSPEAIANNLRDELKRLRRRRQIANSNNNPSTPRKSLMATSPLKSSPPSSPEPMAMEDSAAVRTALKQIGSSSPPRSMFGSPRSGLGAPLSPQSCGLQMKNAENSSSNKPIFTLKQMTVICDRMCKERTEELRSEYDKILNQKLAEQYDAFVKFIDHQIQQRFAQSQLPSYLS